MPDAAPQGADPALSVFRARSRAGTACGNYGGASYIAARGARYALFYAPNGVDVPVRLGMLPGGTVRAAWYSPVTGETQEIGVLTMRASVFFARKARPGSGYRPVSRELLTGGEN
ncbi:putative collagen-binding domain-containing protein [Hominenteromicrobium sp.]|uniref:putative collagen-binding domain-containing protein n=1 Tax=Hominenteromicrobium sp. TaxID=3073581 RepID=UPI00399595CC